MNKTVIYIISAILLVVIVVVIIKERKMNNTENQANQNISQNTNQNSAPNQAAAGSASTTNTPSQSNPSTDCSDQNFDGKLVVLETSMGKITIALYAKDAPKTVQNFGCLTEKGYYNGLIFHRVSHGFVIQSGDPTGTGSGGQSIWGGTFADELNPNTSSYKAGYLKGVVAMANRGPNTNTNTSQFFIMTADHTDLPHSYTIFGKVTAGQDVVDKIGAVPVVPGPFGPDDGTPVDKITINKATLE